MTDRHPQFPLLESYWDNKHRGRLIVDDGEISVVYYFYTDFVNMLLGLIFYIIVVLHSDSCRSGSIRTAPCRGTSGTHHSYGVLGSGRLLISCPAICR
jgi:hypothetical protein